MLIVGRRLARMIAIALATMGCTSEAQVDVRKQAIVGGTIDSGDPGVVLVIPADLSSICSGFVVSPHVVVTAAHCVNGAGPYEVVVGSSVDFNVGPAASNVVSASSVAYDHTFDPNHVENGHDIGVVVLSAPLSTTPLTLSHAALSAAMVVGATARIVGWGVTSPNDQGATLARRQVSTPVTALDTIFVTAGSASHSTCGGDAGGPLLLTIASTEVVAGVVSFGGASCTGSFYSDRADTIAAFVDPYIAADTGGNDASTGGGDGAADLRGDTGSPPAEDGGADARNDAGGSDAGADTSPDASASGDAHADAGAADGPSSTDGVAPADASQSVTDGGAPATGDGGRGDTAPGADGGQRDGSPGDGATPDAAGDHAAAKSSSGGCSCAEAPSPPSQLGVAILVALAMVSRRRRVARPRR
jgi:uncharacterized protein (TIGR03382 family)